jgi:pimeloyl-ACP methyl ester carboxylesterase
MNDARFARGDPFRPACGARRRGCRRGVVLPWLAAALLIAGCAPPVGPMTTPIETLGDPSPCGSPAPLRLVMLPGAYSRAVDFVNEGFVAMLRERDIDADLLLVEAHFGYYAGQQIAGRLAAELLPPAPTQATWLVGISLGGFGALATAALHGERLAGVFAIAPYPGTRDTQREIAAAGGLRAWANPAAPPTGEAEDGERRLWRWLAAPPSLRIEAGLARGDRFIDGQRLLVSTLPAERVDEIAGGHDWPAWRELWRRFLDRRSDWPRCGARRR